jgi:hypothetical protein
VKEPLKPLQELNLELLPLPLSETDVSTRIEFADEEHVNFSESEEQFSELHFGKDYTSKSEFDSSTPAAMRRWRVWDFARNDWRKCRNA